MNWVEIASVISSVATAVAALAVVVTVLIYYGHLKAMTKGRQLESVLVIMSYANDRELRKARHLMLEHQQDQDHERIFVEPFSDTTRREADEKDRQLSSNEVTLHGVDLALNSINNACYLIRYGYAPEEAADVLLKNSLRRSRLAFRSYTEFRRRRPDIHDGGPSRYAEHFKWVIKPKYGELNNSPDEGRDFVASVVVANV